MKQRCISVSDRNEDANELLEEYADMWGMSASGAFFHIVRDYSRLMFKERQREMGARR